MASVSRAVTERSAGAVCAFLLALALRFLNVASAFDHGRAVIAPVDELYHWKRITFSAQHFPHVLELDRDRGIEAAFCPWPPLYDLASGGLARLLGARAPEEVLRRAVWIPPIVGALAVAFAAFVLARRFGRLAGAVAAVALATSPFIVTQASIGNIDHHFLEWPLVFAVMVASGPWALGAAMLAALFVQSALIIACALALVVAFVSNDRKRLAGAFFASAAVIVIYRFTRASGYPDTAWFLGWPHAALLAAAGVACRIERRLIGAICGLIIAVVALFRFREGIAFFGGDRWLQTILEFQPMWRSHGADLRSQICGLSAGAVLVWVLAAQALRRRDRTRGAIALFAIVFLALTITNRRFWSVSIPLLAVAGAVCAASFEKRIWRITAAASVALIPAVQLATWMRHPTPVVERYQIPWIRAAEFLRERPPGRVLTNWPMGHTFDVIGKHAVVIDNFGSMPDRGAFLRANEAILSPDEDALARYCDATNVRYVALYDPAFGLRTSAAILGVPIPRSSWYERAYANDLSTPRFHRIHRSDAEFARAAVVVWEYHGGV